MHLNIVVLNKDKCFIDVFGDYTYSTKQINSDPSENRLLNMSGEVISM